MIQELNKLQLLKQYKTARVVFMKDEENNYIENLQMLIFFPEYKNPVFASKLNSFEIIEVKKYIRKRKWENIPFFGESIPVTVKKVKIKESEFGRLRKFYSQFRFSTQNYLYDEVAIEISKLDGSKFTEKPKKKSKPRKRVSI